MPSRIATERQERFKTVAARDGFPEGRKKTPRTFFYRPNIRIDLFSR